MDEPRGWTAARRLPIFALLLIVSAVPADPLDDIRRKAQRDREQIRQQFETHRKLILAEFAAFEAAIAKRKPGTKLALPLQTGASRNLVQHRAPPGKRAPARVFAFVDRAYELRAEPVAEPGAGTGIVDVSPGQRVEVLLMLRRPSREQRDESFRWCLVRTADDEEGYLPSTYLRSSAEAESRRKPGFIFVSDRTGTPLRKGPDESEIMLARLLYRTELQVLRRTGPRQGRDGNADHWYFVRYKTLNGWVFGAYVDPERPKKSLLPVDTKPFVVPVSGGRTSDFGPRVDPFTKKSNAFHSGIDIAAPTGTAVLAALDGTVAQAKRAGGYGKLIMLEHDNGLVTYYAHLSGYAVKKERAVTRGQVIGYVGSTGRSTGPHLHFEVRSGGEAKNPDEYLPL